MKNLDKTRFGFIGLSTVLALLVAGCGGSGPDDPGDPPSLGDVAALDVQIVQEIETRSSVLQPGDRFVVEGDPAAQQALQDRLLAILSAPQSWQYGAGSREFSFAPDGYYEYDNYTLPVGPGHSEGYPTLFAIGAYYLADGRGPFIGAEVVIFGDPNDANNRQAIVASNALMVHVNRDGIESLYEAR